LLCFAWFVDVIWPFSSPKCWRTCFHQSQRFKCARWNSGYQRRQCSIVYAFCRRFESNSLLFQALAPCPAQWSVI